MLDALLNVILAYSITAENRWQVFSSQSYLLQGDADQSVSNSCQQPLTIKRFLKIIHITCGDFPNDHNNPNSEARFHLYVSC